MMSSNTTCSAAEMFLQTFNVSLTVILRVFAAFATPL